MNDKERCDKLALRETKVKTVINETLNPSKKKLITLTTQSRTFYIHLTSQKMITKALSTAAGTDYELHLKHPPSSCFINNYSPSVLKAWQANMDLQPVFNHHKCVKCVTYLCSYIHV